jgi:hypothetical protein
MLNHELRAEFADCLPGSKVAIINPDTDGNDYQRWGISKITFLPNTSPDRNRPEDTIIEAGPDNDFMRVEEFITILGEQDSDGTVQVFVAGWEGQQFAYFDIARVRRGPYLHCLILGDWRCGG